MFLKLNLVFSLVGVLCGLPAWGTIESAAALRVTEVVHSVCDFCAVPPDEASVQWHEMKLAVEEISQPTILNEFGHYAYGAGLLRLDTFRQDLGGLFDRLTQEEQPSPLQVCLTRLGFDRFVLELASASERHYAAGRELFASLEQATDETLEAQQKLLRHAGRAEAWLYGLHSTIVLSASVGFTLAFYDLLAIESMTPREFIAYLGGLWGLNAGSYWLLWEYFRWIDPYRKLAARTAYQELTASWEEFQKYLPQISARVVASAASDRPPTHVRYADVVSDAALNALLVNEASEVDDQLFELFLQALESGNGARANRIVQGLSKRKGSTDRARLAEVVQVAFDTRRQMEWKSYSRQAMRAGLRLGILALGIWGFNEAAKVFVPQSVVQWRAVPMAVLGAIGIRRLFPVFWKPAKAQTLRTRIQGEEKELEQALQEIMRLDPSGTIVSRFARFDAGTAAHQLITEIASRVLSERPSGQATQNLFRLVREKLGDPTFRDRSHALVQATFLQQRSCLQSLLELSQRWRGVFSPLADNSSD